MILAMAEPLENKLEIVIYVFIVHFEMSNYYFTVRGINMNGGAYSKSVDESSLVT